MADTILYLFCRERFDLLRVCLAHLYEAGLERVEIVAFDDGSTDPRVVDLLRDEMNAGRIAHVKAGPTQRYIGPRRIQALSRFLKDRRKPTYSIQMDADMLVGRGVISEALAAFDRLRAWQPTVKRLDTGTEKPLRIGALSLCNLGQKNQAVGSFQVDGHSWRTLSKWGEALWIGWRQCMEDVGAEKIKPSASGETEPLFVTLTEKTWHYALATPLAGRVVHGGCWHSAIIGQRPQAYLTYADYNNREPAKTQWVYGSDLHHNRRPDWEAIYEKIVKQWEAQ